MLECIRTVRARPASCGASPEPLLAEAQDDATILAIKAQDEAGLDIITDGEIRREIPPARYRLREDAGHGRPGQDRPCGNGWVGLSAVMRAG